jgi:L-ascorbate metabolism protein UlaG (beta-lactamase superfamily)
VIEFHLLGHAGVRIRSQGQSLVIDPWFGRPFSGNNMVAYPPIPRPTASELADTVAVHVSHVHQDHLCGDGLGLFARNTPLAVGRYPQSGFAQALRGLGFTDVREIPEDGLEIGVFRLHNVALDPFDGSFDSLLIVAAEGRTILLNNDCILSDAAYEALRQRFGRIDYGFLGYAPVSPYPVCYEIRGNAAAALLEASWQHSLDHLAKLDALFSFERIVPYANGIRLLCPATRAMNAAFIPIDRIRERLAPQVAHKLYLSEPGQQWDERFVPRRLRHGYDVAAICEHFDRTGATYSYPFAEVSPLPNDRYEHFFSQYFQAVERKRGLDIDIVCRITDDTFRPLAAYRYRGGEARWSPQDIDREGLIRLDLPSAWINEVVLGRMVMGSLYYAFQFRARYPWNRVPHPWRVHRWS